MKMDTDKILESILESINHVEHMTSDDIPNIPLYMDQVTTLMNEKLKNSKRYEDDKILTKTMINNYAKNNLLPPPVKKKYDREHVLVLLFIYYFKNILSIKDIETLLQPLTSTYFSNDKDFNIKDIYDEVLLLEKDTLPMIQENVRNAYKLSEGSFTDMDDPEQKFLQLFSFICILSFNVYVQKQIIENLIDTFPFEDLLPKEEMPIKDKK